MADQPTNDWRTTLKRRLTVTAVVVVLWASAIEARLFYLQVVERADLAARAERQQSSKLTAAGKRGDILDRNGHLLAYSVDAESVYGVPTVLLDAGKDPGQVVTALCGALQDCTADERKKLIERFGGKGGGRPDLAQGGGLQGTPDEIVRLTREIISTAV